MYKILTKENMRIFFIYMAYLIYSFSVVIKNQLNIQLGNWEYIFVVLNLVCIKLAENTKKIEQIINHVDLEKMDNLLDQLMTVSNTISTGRTEILEINEPFNEEPEADTHRDINLNENYIIRVKK